MLVENLQEESLKGQRIVYDHMSSLDTTNDKCVVTKELATHCKGGCAKYNATLQEQKNGKQCDDREKKRKSLSEEIANVKCMKMSVEDFIAALRNDADSLSIECENEKDMKVVMQLVVKSNSFRKTTITELTKAIIKLENELKYG